MFDYGRYIPTAQNLYLQMTGACDQHRAMSWSSTPARRCWVCHPEDWHEPEGRTEHPPSIVPDPTEAYRPAVSLCQVARNPDNDAPCNRPWDGKHTVLGFAVCVDCWEAIRES